MNSPQSYPHPELDVLLAAVRRRYHRLHAIRLAVMAFAMAAAAVAAMAAFGWVLRGEAVPAWPFLVVPMAAAGVAWVVYWRGRISVERAAVLADAHFGLKDGLTSALYLQRTAGGGDEISELQWRWLRDSIAECRAESIRWPFPRRSAVLGTALAAVAIWLGVLPPSPEVLAAREDAHETRLQVEAAKEHLTELIDALDEETEDADERAALEMDEFRKMVESIDPTGDRTEAARQFARIEQKMRDAARSLDQRRDMETLRLAASELAKAGETEPRQLGRKLENEELREAAEMLEKLAPKPRDPEDLKDPESGKREIDEARKELARMRAVTRRMAAAGRQRKGAAQAAGGAGAEGGAGAAGAAGAAGGRAGEGAGESPETLEDLMASLDEAAEDMEQALREIELDPDSEIADGEFGECQACANGLLDEMQGKLRRMNAKAKAASKLERMMRGLAQARGMCQGGQQNQMGLAQSPGGREAGTGTDESRRTDDGEDDAAAGGLASLRGQHGSGPSLSSIEAAESGTGVSGRRGEARDREFARQTESFVQRDDVPETLKLGVRNYFENLQAAAPRADDEE